MSISPFQVGQNYKKTKGRVSNYLVQAFGWEAESLLLNHGFLPILITRKKAEQHKFRVGANQKVLTYKVFKTDKKNYFEFFNKYFDQNTGIRFSGSTPTVVTESKAWLELVNLAKSM
jgi:hypothetical protein